MAKNAKLIGAIVGSLKKQPQWAMMKWRGWIGYLVQESTVVKSEASWAIVIWW